MDRVPVHNNTAMPIYVGATMIPPGETRHFHISEVPEHLRPAPAAPAAEVKQADPVAEKVAQLQELNAKDLIASVNAAEGDADYISDAELEALGDAEQTRKDPRKTVLEAIATEQLQRAEKAAQQTGGGQQ